MEETPMAEEKTDTSLLELATELTMAWLSNPNTRAAADDVPAFLDSMHSTVMNLALPGPSGDEIAPAKEYLPAVTVRRSLASKDHIISLIDGKPYKTLKRHLAGHGLTPDEYRERYGLKSDYPMVAETYAEMRRGLAKKIGLGRKAGTKVAAKEAANPAAANAAGKSAAKPGAKDAKPASKPKAPRRAKSTVAETPPQS
jgi:predicted transcriptional regulator